MTLAAPLRRMPTAPQLGDFLGDLVGKDVSVTALATELPLDDDTGLLTGVLVEENGHVGGACIVDVAAGAYLGAALAMIPKAGADECVETGELSENLSDNFAEVVNIVSGIVNTPINAHLRMQGVEHGVPGAVRDLLIKASGRTTFAVEIEDYGTGTLALYAH